MERLWIQLTHKLFRIASHPVWSTVPMCTVSGETHQDYDRQYHSSGMYKQTGVCKIWKLQQKTREIWQFANCHKAWLSAVHCPGVENIEADEASRAFDDKTEWTLHQAIFQYIVNQFGTPSIDLFASRLNCKTARYCAWQPDPGAVAIDSLALNWGTERLVYAFRPFSIIHKVVQKFITDEAFRVLVVPLWPTQPWFSLFTRLICGQPMTFNVKTNELYLPFSTIQDMSSGTAVHPLAGQLTMIVATCNGQLWRPKASVQTSLPRCCEPGEEAPTGCMELTSESGRTIVISGQSTITRHLSLKH